jgi:hypothetical protein
LDLLSLHVPSQERQPAVVARYMAIMSLVVFRLSQIYFFSGERECNLVQNTVQLPETSIGETYIYYVSAQTNKMHTEHVDSGCRPYSRNRYTISGTKSRCCPPALPPNTGK